jgi:hypothetical protein
MLTHPTLDLLHDLGLHGMAKGFKESNKLQRLAPSNMPNGSASCSNTRQHCDGRSASRPAPGPHGCAIMPASRTSITTPLVASIARCSSSSQAATSSASGAIF